ncbi:collagenase [Kitasatospora sp. CM 4170]|uniref:microbial collagenase n=1 Tax=Kitasatospora aburaviensis TaxID=67265 RepID=A0ABW1F870_9ACTN|nr:collagenase [Kitasatospora sp. CM 4170]WNM44150.1 collagenase [Kitasatospora sp. CM 4170]
MSTKLRLRNTLLSAAVAVTLAAPLIRSAQPAVAADAPTPAAASPARSGGTGVPAPAGWDGAERLQPNTGARSDAPSGPSAGEPAAAPATASAGPTAAHDASCSREAFTALSPSQVADFLADPAHTYDDCLLPLLGSWDTRFTRLITPAYVQAVAARVSALAPSFDNANNHNQRGLWYFLHVAVLFDYDHDEIDVKDAGTVAAIEHAIQDYTANPRVFEVTTANGWALGELLHTGTAPTLRTNRLGLIKRVLPYFAAGSRATGDEGWNWAVYGALRINFQGIENVGEDPQGTFRAAVAADAEYREAFRAYAGYTHLKGTKSDWTVADAMLEYTRIGALPGLTAEVAGRLPWVFQNVTDTYGRLSYQWGALAAGAAAIKACAPYRACPSDVDPEIFPHTYSYDNGTLVVRTALDRATADQLYYATKQVKAQFFRTIGTDQPLPGDEHPVLTVQLYDTKTHYKNLQRLLAGIADVENGGMFLEDRSTFYTYQRVVGVESYLSLEELFRHEYTHYLNARWAIPDSGYTKRWPGDATFAMNEGTAEYFAGATRDDGVRLRKNMVDGIATDLRQGNRPLTVDQIVHATWSSLGFRAYPYAATFFNLLGEKHPDRLAEMYRLLRADDRAGYDAWRDRLGRDAGLQAEYTAFIDAALPRATELFVPDTDYTANGRLNYAWASEVQSAFASATQNAPLCKDNADWNNKMRFSCSGRITANLTDSADTGRVRQDMASTVDHYLLNRGGGAANNLADMNCWFGKVDVWPDGRAGTADYTCEGPLRR